MRRWTIAALGAAAALSACGSSAAHPAAAPPQNKGFTFGSQGPWPVANVVSVLVCLRLHGRGAPMRLRVLVLHGFAHRRKALARSLALSPGGSNELRDRAREALQALGHPADARAETLSPSDWRALWERLK